MLLSKGITVLIVNICFVYLDTVRYRYINSIP